MVIKYFFKILKLRVLFNFLRPRSANHSTTFLHKFPGIITTLYNLRHKSVVIIHARMYICACCWKLLLLYVKYSRSNFEQHAQIYSRLEVKFSCAQNQCSLCIFLHKCFADLDLNHIDFIESQIPDASGLGSNAYTESSIVIKWYFTVKKETSERIGSAKKKSAAEKLAEAIAHKKQTVYKFPPENTSIIIN